MVDAIVATGASIVDMDFFEALGFKHYQAPEIRGRQHAARSLYIDRIYDTYIDEEELQDVRPHDLRDRQLARARGPTRRASSSTRWARWLAAGNAKKENCLIQPAYEEGVPIFCPAFVD